MNSQKYQGVYHSTKKGYGYVTIKEDGAEKNIAVIASYKAGVFDGDEVTVTLQDNERGNRNNTSGEMCWGKIVGEVKHVNDIIVGEYSVNDSDHKEYIIPDSYIPFRVQVRHDEGEPEIEPGDKVLASIRKYRAVAAMRVTPLVNFGRANTYGANFRSAIYGTHLYEKFPASAVKQASTVKPFEVRDHISGRLDLKGKTVITFADTTFGGNNYGFSVTKENDEWTLGIHIVDVAEYVAIDSPLDIECKKRGREIFGSLYGSPLFPRTFESTICSYREQSGVLSVSTFIKFDNYGNVIDTEFFETVVYSTLVASASDVDVLISKGNTAEIIPLRQKYSSALELLESLYELAGVLRSKRLSDGDVDFDLFERTFKMDSEHRIKYMSIEPQSDTSLMVNELFIAAGKAAAEKMFYSGYSCVYSSLSEKKCDAVTGSPEGRFFLPENDYKYSGYTKREASAVRGTGFESFCYANITEECERAALTFSPAQHYLYKAEKYIEYFHPSAKYSDLVNLRAIKAYVKNENFDVSRFEEGIRNEEKACEVKSKLIKLMTVEYIEENSTKFFNGTAIKTTPGGVYILLDCGAYGFLPNDKMGSENVIVGNEIKVKAIKTNFVTGSIIFSCCDQA